MRTKDGSKHWWRKLGPGLVTGAADDDPSGIATYSQGGAQFGFGALWTLLFTYPLMVAVQLVAARIGRVTGRGLAANLCQTYSSRLMLPLVAGLLIANVINIAADLAAMADVLELVIGGNSHGYAVFLGVGSALLQVFVPYRRYAKFLKWLTLALFAYVGVVLVVEVPWGEVAVATLVPSIEFSAAFLTIVVAIFGTTISPYLFFWQASQEVEEQRAIEHTRPLRDDPAAAPAQLRRVRIDTLVGMAFSNLIAFFIMLTAAVTLHAQGVHDIESSAQAAEALRPVAGDFAFVLFSIGIIGTGLLAVPVLAGAAGYALGEALKLPVGLYRKPKSARGFYAIIAVATLLGIAFDFADLSPMRALVVAAVVNGVVAVPILAAMMALASQPRVMGALVISARLRFAGWTATAVMAAMVGLMGWTLLA